MSALAGAHLLIVSMYYWPEETGNAPYVADLAEYLAHLDHRVTVLCGMPHYPQWRIADGYRGHFSIAEHRSGVAIERRWHLVPGQQSAARRAAYEASFMLGAAGFRPKPRPDAVVGVVPSLGGGLLARYMAARARAAYGLIFQDLVSSAARQSGIAGGTAVASLASHAERWMTRRATVVAPVSDAFVPYLAQLGVPSKRIAVLPNWSRLGKTKTDRRLTRSAAGWRDDEFVALHAGNMGLKQGLEQIVEAARLADEAGAPVRFVLMGDGNQRESLEALARRVERLELRPFVDRSELPDMLAAADALLVSERPSVSDMSLPSKLTAYFAAGQPVVAVVEPRGATARHVERSGAGVVVPAGHPSALVEAVLQLRAQPDVAARWGENGRRYAETELRQDAILAEASRLVDRVIQRTADVRGNRAS